MMDGHRTVELGDLDDFVEAQVETGRYENADAVVRAGLSILKEREREQEELRAAIAEGEAAYQRGEYKEYGSAEELFDDIMRQVRERLPEP